jgi:hypothetical protein
MANRVESLEDRTSLTRRKFTLEAALAILAGCVITIADTACDDSKPTAAPSPTPTPTPTPSSDVTGTVSANHGHVAVIMGAQITAGNAIALNIMGTATHPHTVMVSQADLTSLKNRQAVTITSSTDSGHSHAVTFTP